MFLSYRRGRNDPHKASEAKAKLTRYGQLSDDEPAAVTVNGRRSFQLVPLEKPLIRVQRRVAEKLECRAVECVAP